MKTLATLATAFENVRPGGSDGYVIPEPVTDRAEDIAVLVLRAAARISPAGFTVTFQPVAHLAPWRGTYDVGRYAVGGARGIRSLVLPGADLSDTHQLRAFINRAHASGAGAVGGWHGPRGFELDAVDFFANRERAESVGRERGELAIFDRLDSVEIKL
jgi:hypothetical protein